jgi:hypothetical protein
MKKRKTGTEDSSKLKNSYHNICTSRWLPYEVNFIIFWVFYWVCGRKQETENYLFA